MPILPSAPLFDYDRTDLQDGAVVNAQRSSGDTFTLSEELKKSRRCNRIISWLWKWQWSMDMVMVVTRRNVEALLDACTQWFLVAGRDQFFVYEIPCKGERRTWQSKKPKTPTKRSRVSPNQLSGLKQRRRQNKGRGSIIHPNVRLLPPGPYIYIYIYWIFSTSLADVAGKSIPNIFSLNVCKFISRILVPLL